MAGAGRRATGTEGRYLLNMNNVLESICIEESIKHLGLSVNAVVSLGGCTASFVSPDGLIITNHHCATGALQFNSTPKENLLVDGYLAKTRADEDKIGTAIHKMLEEDLSLRFARDPPAHIQIAGLSSLPSHWLR